jgi:hypothetical protein
VDALAALDANQQQRIPTPVAAGYALIRWGWWRSEQLLPIIIRWYDQMHTLYEVVQQRKGLHTQLLLSPLCVVFHC